MPGIPVQTISPHADDISRIKKAPSRDQVKGYTKKSKQKLFLWKSLPILTLIDVQPVTRGLRRQLPPLYKRQAGLLTRRSPRYARLPGLPVAFPPEQLSGCTLSGSGIRSLHTVTSSCRPLTCFPFQQPRWDLFLPRLSPVIFMELFPDSSYHRKKSSTRHRKAPADFYIRDFSSSGICACSEPLCLSDASSRSSSPLRPPAFFFLHA